MAAIMTVNPTITDEADPCCLCTVLKTKVVPAEGKAKEATPWDVLPCSSSTLR